MTGDVHGTITSGIQEHVPKCADGKVAQINPAWPWELSHGTLTASAASKPQIGVMKCLCSWQQGLGQQKTGRCAKHTNPSL